jgi:hypothetical protein
MSAGIRAFRRIQIGQETVAGTKVVATQRLRGLTGVIKDNTIVEFLEEDIGIAGGALSTRIPKTGGEIALTGGFTYEQAPYIFNGAFYETTPTTDVSSAKIWTWTAQTSSTDKIETTDLQTYTIEAGDNQQAEYFTYGFVREFSLAGTVGGGLDLSATLEGRQVGTTDFTAGIAIPTVEYVLFAAGKLYVDASTDIGVTQVSQTLFASTLNVTTGWKAYAAADGRVDFSFAKWIGSDITLNVTFEHNSSAVAEKAAWRAQTERAIRLQFDGTALTTSTTDTPYDNKTLIVDLWGKWETFDALTDQDGNDHVTGTFRAGYSASSGLKARVIVVNQTASLA